MSVDTLCFSIHHLGIAVADIDHSLAFYRDAFGLTLVSGPFTDPIQKVRVCFLGNHEQKDFLIELVTPADPGSPVMGFLSKGTGAYHICYEVDDLAKTLEDMQSKGCVVLSAPQPAIAFGGRRIAWCFLPTKHLVEFVESDRPTQAV